jgi:two-component system cell cycle sensor histidine kinase/response regulator CckA
MPIGIDEVFTSSRGKRVPGNSIIDWADLVAAVEQAADGIVVTDTGGIIRFVNPAFTAMTGYSSEEAIGQKPKSSNRGTSRLRSTWSCGVPSGRVGSGTAS